MDQVWKPKASDLFGLINARICWRGKDTDDLSQLKEYVSVASVWKVTHVLNATKHTGFHKKALLDRIDCLIPTHVEVYKNFWSGWL